MEVSPYTIMFGRVPVGFSVPIQDLKLAAAEKFEIGQPRQGLKPDSFSVVYGPTEVVP
jgi:hypothetical protein